MQENIWNDENLIEVLKKGGVVIMPTDTIYGMVGRAENEAVVRRIYSIRKRNPEKPCIILIGDIKELEKFSVFPTEEQKKVLKNHWRISAMADMRQPEPISIILDCPDEKFAYLHRGTKTLAFRLPTSPELRELLMKVGPLIAPSANLEAEPPSGNIEDAKKYFGDSVDLYIDGEEIKSKASKLIELHKDGTVNILRE